MWLVGSVSIVMKIVVGVDPRRWPLGNERLFVWINFCQKKCCPVFCAASIERRKEKREEKIRQCYCSPILIDVKFFHLALYFGV